MKHGLCDCSASVVLQDIRVVMCNQHTISSIYSIPAIASLLFVRGNFRITICNASAKKTSRMQCSSASYPRLVLSDPSTVERHAVSEANILFHKIKEKLGLLQ